MAGLAQKASPSQSIGLPGRIALMTPKSLENSVVKISAMATLDVTYGTKYAPTTKLRLRFNVRWIRNASGSATRCCGTPDATANHSVVSSDFENHGSVIAYL